MAGSGNAEGRPASSRAQLLSAYRYRLLFGALSVLLVGNPLFAALPLGAPISGWIGLLVLLYALAIPGSAWVSAAAVLLALPAGASLLGAGGDLAGPAESAFYVPLFGFAAVVVTARVLRSESADIDTVAGSLCAYFLTAVAFASVYAALETLVPGSFAFARGCRTEELFGELVYFSFVAITTLGYGDVTPVAAAARSIASLESVGGVLFAAIVIARIVGLAATGGGRPFTRRDPKRRERPGRFELLLLVALVVILAGPFLSGGGIADHVLRALVSALLIAALYAGSDSRVGRVLGIALASAAGAGQWLLTPATSTIGLAAGLCETAFLVLVSVSLIRWLARERVVTRDVLLASLALYLLLGFAFSSAFQLLESVQVGSVLTPDGLRAEPIELQYFSFMTLTTTGFGEFSPGTPMAQRLAAFESLLGVFYPAVLVARLVSLYQSE